MGDMFGPADSPKYLYLEIKDYFPYFICKETL